MATIRNTKRQSKWQSKLAQARKNLVWAWERVQWMALGVLIGLCIAWIWR